MRRIIGGIAALVLSSAASSYAFLDGDGEMIYRNSLVEGTCSYEGYTLSIKCDLSKMKAESRDQDSCDITNYFCETTSVKDAKGKIVPFPEYLDNPIVGVQISPFREILYCNPPVNSCKMIS